MPTDLNQHLTQATFRRWMVFCATAMTEQHEYLTQLDAAIGDADHGTNMVRGFQSIETRLESLPETALPSEVLLLAGTALMGSGGGASGPLWGVALRRAGKVLEDLERVSLLDFAEALRLGLEAVRELGAAELGEKTMVDALEPGVQALLEAAAQNLVVDVAFERARQAAETGARLTAPMIALKGRASYLGDRAIGHQDPGAVSTVFIFEALQRALVAA
jgi:phosphoenolpyruvate---glycerone phosphotransferase subunit DhaL